jgi:hypothetical protein
LAACEFCGQLFQKRVKIGSETGKINEEKLKEVLRIFLRAKRILWKQKWNVQIVKWNSGSVARAKWKMKWQMEIG